jgi:hypothetical protein
MTVASSRPVEDRLAARRPVSVSSWRSSASLAFVVLTAVYVVLSLFASPHAYLSTDVGGKTAALAAMMERGDWSTDIGYWAADADPEGLAYPFTHTSLTETGWWVNTTSLPMVLAARPLWAIGGAQLILLIPMMAAAGAAVVAGRIQQRLRPGGGRWAVWIVGLATPLVVYALDFWEHTLGVFLMALGSLWVLDAADPGDGTDRASLGRATLIAGGAGLAFGLASTMRQEALVYGFVAGLTLAISSLIILGAKAGTGRRVRVLLPSAAMAVAALSVLAANSLLEAWFYGSAFRSTRSAGAAAAAGTELRERFDASFTITLSPINAIHPIATFFGLLLLAGMAWLMVEVRRGGELRRPGLFLIGIGAVLGLRVLQSGPSFVPGLLPTTPLAMAGLGLGVVGRPHRLVAAMALGPLPIVYLTQYSAGAVPQWGGRYILTTGLLLVVLACAELPDRHPGVFRALAIAGLMVTATGVWFNAVRTNSLADDFELLEQVADGDVVVWYDNVKAREGGPEVVEHRWISTVGGAETSTVLSILEAQSVDRFVYVDPVDEPTPSFEGFVARSDVGAWEMSSILRQRLTTFERIHD